MVYCGGGKYFGVTGLLEDTDVACQLVGLLNDGTGILAIKIHSGLDY